MKLLWLGLSQRGTDSTILYLGGIGGFEKNMAFA